MIDDKKIYTPEELEQICLNEVNSFMDKKKVPQSVLLVEQDIETANSIATDLMGELGSFIGAKRLLEINSYWEFRDRVHEYQKQYNVSGLTFGEMTVDGKLVKFPKVCGQLILLPDDMDVLKAFVPRAIELFRHWSERNNAYVRYVANLKGGWEFDVETNLRHIEYVSESADWVELDFFLPSSGHHDESMMIEVGWGNYAAANRLDDTAGDSVLFYADRSCAFKPSSLQLEAAK
ncbi:hypothetical protein H6F86_20985 [Phormidium sp. FACHB-592]|uniref:B3 domain-containing protein n=1 Tax=Stenomitos frigidus AS-A4 TaxID=2933935 RepID=A0ABV0KER0_9CYAN|nr:hypothetical protein [Phormidium sp. FACHB-592]MBD2076310.1 hypothetical protein [Phormidium sp. FACHB-592]